MFNPKKILVTTDFSNASDSALKEAADIARRYNSQVHLLHVIEDIRQCAVDYCLSEAEISSVEGRLREDAELRMREMIKRVAPDTMAEIVKEIRFGSVVGEAVALEHERAIDLVIAAPHRQRRRWLKDTHHLLTALVNKSACETMIVK